MIKTNPYHPSPAKTLKSVGLLILLLLFLVPVSYAQNTKGDRTEAKSGGKRESRFRQPKKKKIKSKGSYNRVQSRGPSSSSSARSKPKKEGKNVYPQKSGPAPRDPQDKWSGGRKTRVNVRSATGKTRNVYPQRGPYVNNSSKKPRDLERSVSNRSQLAKIKRISHQPDPPKRKRVTPNSASRSYVSRRSINAFAGFWNKKPKGEKAYVGDISGRKLRTKNFETKKPKISKSATTPYYGRKRVGDKPYKGPSGGYMSTTRSGKAWKGDVAGRKIRGRNFSSRKTTEPAGKPIFPPKKSRVRVGDRPYKGFLPGGGYQSVSGKVRKGQGPVPVKTPGIGANKIDTYRGNIRGGKTFSPQGGNYAGNLKTRRPLKGGGSVSGKKWNNKGLPIGVRTPSRDAALAGTYQGDIRGKGKIFTPQGADYSGSIKTKKPLKGGGSVSGKRWNNKGLPIGVRTPSRDAALAGTYQGDIRGKGKIFTPQGADYSGSIKTKKPLKGGGSVSGKMWNNKGLAIGVRTPSNDAAKAATFQGNIKAGRQLKGGGSVSGKIWNNKQSPIPTRMPSADAEKVAGYPGGYKMFDLRPGMRNQGEEFTGYLKGRRKPLKGGGSVSGKLWNNKEQPIIGKTPGDAADEVDAFKGKVKLKREYVKNPNATGESLKKLQPHKSTYLVNGLQIKVKEQDYKKRPHAPEGSMPGIAPGKNSIKASEYSKGVRLKWNYKHNPSSADDALDTHEPGKAFAHATDYQGNIKMKKFNIFGKKELHPDAKFVKTNKNNTDEERDMLTNFKLWWARLFKKSDTQPDHLKEKIRKPRYDKGEIGMWYD